MSKGQQTRQHIITEALSLAGDLGLENVTLGVLATELDLSKSGLFAHFNSKEALQQAVLDEAVRRFVEAVVRPAIEFPRGEPRFVSLFERYIGWIVDAGGVTGKRNVAADRCFFMALSHEYDDRPGRLRDTVVKSQRDWRNAVARAARIAIEEGHFRGDLDIEQAAFEFVGIGMVFQQSQKLLADPKAEERARLSFRSLLARCRVRKRELAPRRAPKASLETLD